MKNWLEEHMLMKFGPSSLIKVWNKFLMIVIKPMKNIFNGGVCLLMFHLLKQKISHVFIKFYKDS